MRNNFQEGPSINAEMLIDNDKGDAFGDQLQTYPEDEAPMPNAKKGSITTDSAFNRSTT